MAKVSFLIDDKSIEVLTKEGFPHADPLLVQEKNITGKIIKEYAYSETPLVTEKLEVSDVCYFKSRPVVIVKLVDRGRPITPRRVIIRGRLALLFPGISVGTRIFVPKESTPFFKEWSLRKLLSFSRSRAPEGFEALSGVVHKVFPYHLDERISGSIDRHLSVWTKSGSLYLVSITAV